MGTIWQHAKFQTLLNKNPPIVVTVQEYDFSGVVLGGRIILSIFTQIRMILLMEMRHVHGGFELRLGIH